MTSEMSEGIDFKARLSRMRRSASIWLGSEEDLVMSGKGGVGKTTVTVNLANALVDAVVLWESSIRLHGRTLRDARVRGWPS